MRLIEQLISHREAAEILGIKPSTLKNWRIRGNGPKYFKVGRAILYRRDEVESFVAARQFTSTSEYLDKETSWKPEDSVRKSL